MRCAVLDDAAAPAQDGERACRCAHPPIVAHGLPILTCGCSRLGCAETYLSAPGLARIAARLGAKIILCPNVLINEYTPVDSSMGPNMRAQENRICAVQSSLVGETGLGFTLEGGGRIFAPNELLRHKNGVMAKTSGRHEPDIACISLDLDRLDAIRNPYTQDKNPDFLQKYIDRLY